MMQDVAVPRAARKLALDDAEAPPTRRTKLRGAALTAGRYGISAFGPLSIAGAHFLAALVFLRMLSPHGFGLVSFAFVAVPPFLSVTLALLSALASHREIPRRGGRANGADHAPEGKPVPVASA